MAFRELNEKEREQRRMLDERFRQKGRAYPPINVLDIGLPAFDETVYEGNELKASD